MTSTQFETQEQSIHFALTGQAAVVTRAGRGHWDVDVEGTGGAPIEVRLTDRWVLCRAPMPNSGDDFEKYLWIAPALPGACKVAFDPESGEFEVREEIPVIEGIDVVDACTRALSNLTAARTKLAKPMRTPRARKKKAGAATTIEFTDELREAAGAAGWNLVEPEDGAPQVTLDLTGGCYQAIPESLGRGNNRLSVSLAPRQSFGDLGRRAIALLLLTANGLVRFARAGFERSADGMNAVFEARFGDRPCTAVLDAALSALAVACGMCGREVGAMGDETIVRRYLDARVSPGLSAPLLEQAQV